MKLKENFKALKNVTETFFKINSMHLYKSTLRESKVVYRGWECASGGLLYNLIDFIFIENLMYNKILNHFMKISLQNLYNDFGNQIKIFYDFGLTNQELIMLTYFLNKKDKNF